MDLQRFELRDTRDLIGWAFRLHREHAGAIDYTRPAAPNPRGVTERMLRFAEAAKVIACIDNRLAPIERDLIRFIWASSSDAEQDAHYNALHNYIWHRTRDTLDKKRASYRDNLNVLRLVAPIEYRARVLKNKSSSTPAKKLAERIGVSEENYSITYKPPFEQMITILEGVKISAFETLDQWLMSMIERRASSAVDLDEVTAEIARLMNPPAEK